MKTLPAYRLYFSFFLLFYIYCSAQAQFFSPGARSSALGGASATLADVWATNNNIGALGFIEQSAVGMYYENKFILPETGTFGLNAAYSHKKMGTFGLALSRFGYKLFNRNAIGLRYARSFGSYISAGIGINYHYIFIGNGYGNASAVSAEIGVLGKVNKNIFIGFHLINPVRMNIGRIQTEKLPMLVRFGISYLWDEKVLTALEVDADPEQKPNVKFGLEYKPVSLFLIRAGFSSRPLGAAFGFGFSQKFFKVDVSASYHQQLGFSPQAGLSFSFGKKRKFDLQPRKKKTNAHTS